MTATGGLAKNAAASGAADRDPDGVAAAHRPTAGGAGSTPAEGSDIGGNDQGMYGTDA